MMFRSHSNTSEYFLRDYVAKAMVMFRLENSMLFSHVKISYLCLKAYQYLVFHWCLYNKITRI